MSESALIGIDLGEHSFHLHGQNKSGREVFRKKISRPQMMHFFANLPSCVVVMEACARSSGIPDAVVNPIDSVGLS